MRAILDRGWTWLRSVVSAIGLGGVVGAVGGGAVGGGLAGGTHSAGAAAAGAAVGVAAGVAFSLSIDALVRWRQWAYVKVLVGLGAAVVLVVVLILWLVGVDISDGGGTRAIPKQSVPDRRTREALERRYAPILRLDSAEQLVPIDRPAFLVDTELKARAGSAEKLVSESVRASTLPSTPCHVLPGCVYFLDVRDAEPDPAGGSSAPVYRALQGEALARGARKTVYAHVTRYDDSGEYAVQYWFFYFFNYRLNEHESDWEQITIRLDSKRQPLNVLYSAHVSGHVQSWARIEKSGDHSVVYAALGSHANYFRPGRYAVAVSCSKVGKAHVCIFERAVCDRADGARQSQLMLDRDYQRRELTGPVFSGSYGSANYVIGTKKPDVLSDPRTRAEWRDPLARLDVPNGAEKLRSC